MTSRRVLLVVTLIFIAGFSALTVLDMVHNGLNPVNILSILILLFLWVGIVGALRASSDR